MLSHRNIELRDHLRRKFELDGPGSSVGNLTLGYTPYWNPDLQSRPAHLASRRSTGARDDRRPSSTAGITTSTAIMNSRFGPGRLKLIGLRHFDHEPVVTTQVTRFDSGADPIGVALQPRLAHRRDDRRAANIAGKRGKNDWQVSLERAFNSLDQRGGLFDPRSQTAISSRSRFPQGTRQRRRKSATRRSRTSAGRSRSNLDLQVAAGGEISTLDRIDDDLPARKFFRPKGSLTLGWRPRRTGTQPQAAPPRRADQLLRLPRPAQAQPGSRECRQSRPRPAAELGGRDRGRPRPRRVGQDPPHALCTTGSTTSSTSSRSATDGQGDRQSAAREPLRRGIDQHDHFRPDRLEGRQARPDHRRSEATRSDPLTGRIAADQRHFRTAGAAARLRHDIPGTPFAWSAYVQYDHYTKNFYPDRGLSATQDLPVDRRPLCRAQECRSGLTVRASVGNVFNGRHTVRSHRLLRVSATARRSSFYREARRAGRPDLQPVGERHLLGCGRSANGRCAHAQDRSWTPSSKSTAPAIRRRSTRTCSGRWYRRLAPASGLTDFGVSHVVLKPGAWSSQRHWHDGEDEFLVMLDGRGGAGRGRRPDRLRAGRLRGLAEGQHQRPSPLQRERRRLRVHRASAAARIRAAAIPTST